MKQGDIAIAIIHPITSYLHLKNTCENELYIINMARIVDFLIPIPELEYDCSVGFRGGGGDCDTYQPLIYLLIIMFFLHKRLLRYIECDNKGSAVYYFHNQDCPPFARWYTITHSPRRGIPKYLPHGGSGQSLKNHNIFCIKEKILKNSADNLKDPFYQYIKFLVEIICISLFHLFDRK